MQGVPVKTSMSPLEIATWGAVYARVVTDAAPSQRSSHATIADAIAAADRAIVDLREALGAEHLSLRLAECGDDAAAKLDVFREHLTRKVNTCQVEHDPWEGRRICGNPLPCPFHPSASPRFTKIAPLDEDLVHMTWSDFAASVRSGAFTDNDGHGELATADSCSDVAVQPSDLHKPRPTWATHVVWYNK